jgi:hypothetical protein
MTPFTTSRANVAQFTRTMPTNPLTRVERAAEAKRRAEHEYRSALRAARDAGYSAAEIAKSAGVSRQGARQALLRLTDDRK